jgi:hypothetical protein
MPFMHYREDELTLLVSRTDIASQDEHLKECAACRERFHFLRQMHEAFVRESMNPPDPRISSILDTAERTDEIHLKLFNPAIELPDFDQHHTVTLLAAEDSPHTMDANAATVFASEKDNILVRAVPDHQGAYRLYVLADDPAKRDGVLVTIIDAGGEKAVVAINHNGTGILHSVIPISWKSVSVHLSLPVGSFRSDGTSRFEIEDSSHGCSVHIDTAGDTVRLAFQCEGLHTPARVLLMTSDGSTEIIQLIDASASLAREKMSHIAAMHVFY